VTRLRVLRRIFQRPLGPSALQVTTPIEPEASQPTNLVGRGYPVRRLSPRREYSPRSEPWIQIGFVEGAGHSGDVYRRQGAPLEVEMRARSRDGKKTEVDISLMHNDLEVLEAAESDRRSNQISLLYSMSYGGGAGICTRVRKYIPAGIYDAYPPLSSRARREEAE
jgi:hypothetical protein